MTFAPVPKYPTDVDEQHELWGANCGPTALAAILGMSVQSVRPLVERVLGSKFKPHKIRMHAGQLMDVLTIADKKPYRIDCYRGQIYWPPDQGLCLLQFDGPWCEPGVNQRARFVYTHTVAAAAGGLLVYDGNARVWLRRAQWAKEVMDELVRDTPRATGWYTSTVIAVR